MAKRRTGINCSPSTSSQAVGKGELLVRLLCLTKLTMCLRPCLRYAAGMQAGSLPGMQGFPLSDAAGWGLPNRQKHSRSPWKEQNLKMPLPYFRSLCGFRDSRQDWFLFPFTPGNGLSQNGARWERCRRGDAAGRCRPPPHPSGDRDERADAELQEAREARKAEKQKQEPDSLMAELVKRKEKWREKQEKEKCVQLS